jgi:hypothetical protein
MARDLPRKGKIARARIGSATPTTNGSGSYNGCEHASIHVGARAPAVVERDDGCSLFLQQMRATLDDLDVVDTSRPLLSRRCTCPKIRYSTNLFHRNIYASPNSI